MKRGWSGGLGHIGGPFEAVGSVMVAQAASNKEDATEQTKPERRIMDNSWKTVAMRNRLFQTVLRWIDK